jgi:hypothetical protein
MSHEFKKHPQSTMYAFCALTKLSCLLSVYQSVQIKYMSSHEKMKNSCSYIYALMVLQVCSIQ